MIFSDIKETNKVGSITLGTTLGTTNKIIIKSRVYNYNNLYKVVFYNKKILTKISPFIISKGKNIEVYEYTRWWDDYKAPDFLYITYLNKISEKNKDKVNFYLYFKWRLGNLGLLMKRYEIDSISLEQLTKFILYDTNNIDTIYKIACFLNYKSDYNIEDIRSIYKKAKKICDNIEYNNNTYDTNMLNFLKMYYNIRIIDNDDLQKVKDIQKFNNIKHKLTKILAQVYDTTDYVIASYHKTLAKLTNYCIKKNIDDDNIKELILKYKDSGDNIHIDINNLVTNKKLNGDKICLKPDNEYLKQFE